MFQNSIATDFPVLCRLHVPWGTYPRIEGVRARLARNPRKSTSDPAYFKVSESEEQ